MRERAAHCRPPFSAPRSREEREVIGDLVIGYWLLRFDYGVGMTSEFVRSRNRCRGVGEYRIEGIGGGGRGPGRVG